MNEPIYLMMGHADGKSWPLFAFKDEATAKFYADSMQEGLDNGVVLNTGVDHVTVVSVGMIVKAPSEV